MIPRSTPSRSQAVTAGAGVAPNAEALRQRLIARHRSARLHRSRLLSGLVLIMAMTLYGVGSGAHPVAAQAATFTFDGSGWGHAVGMSQWGARGMAANGSSYTQILQHYYTGVAVGPAPVNDDLRVLLAERTDAFTLVTSGTTTFHGLGVVGGGQTVSLSRSGNDVALSGAVNAVTSYIDIGLSGAGGPVTVSPPGYSYRYGTLRISADAAGGLRAVIWGLPMQQYLYGLGEMPSSWPAEALKAQATAGRTFAQKRIAARGAADFDLYGSVLHQSYTGTKFEVGAWTGAVDATNGQVISYSGALIDANYSASSGGHTENSENVWVSALPYLRGVPDPYDVTGNNPHASWSRSYSGDELGAWFGLGTVTSVQVLGPLGVSGRVDRSTMRLVGSGGTRDVSGASFRATVNSRVSSTRQLMSTRFTVTGVGVPPVAPQPAGTLPTGAITVATSEGRTVIIGGESSDPDGWPLVRVVSTMGRERAVRDYRSTNGRFLLAWTGSPGTRNVCVTVHDEPSGQGVSLGCRDIVVK